MILDRMSSSKKLIETLFCRRYMLHLVDRYSVHNEILSIMFHEYLLLTIYHTVFVILLPSPGYIHSSRDLRVPSASSLNRSIL